MVDSALTRLAMGPNTEVFARDCYGAKETRALLHLHHLTNGISIAKGEMVFVGCLSAEVCQLKRLLITTHFIVIVATACSLQSDSLSMIPISLQAIW